MNMKPKFWDFDKRDFRLNSFPSCYQREKCIVSVWHFRNISVVRKGKGSLKIDDIHLTSGESRIHSIDRSHEDF